MKRTSQSKKVARGVEGGQVGGVLEHRKVRLVTKNNVLETEKQRKRAKKQ